MKKLSILSVSLSVLLSSQIYAGQQLSQSEIKQSLSQKGDIEGIQELPVKELMLVKTKAGETYFISKNGRFVFQGTLIDTWFRKTIDDLSEARTAHRVPLEKMGVNKDDLAILTFGNKDIPKQASIFVDPHCGVCTALFKMVSQSPEKYHFDFILAPIFGERSKTTISKLHCAADENKAVMDLLHKTSLVTEMKPQCDTSKINNSLIVMNLLEGKGTPFFVRADGLTLNGIPSDLDTWLEME